MPELKSTPNKRFLYLLPGPQPPNKNPELNKFYNIDFIKGDVLLPVWFKSKSDALNYFGKDNYPYFKVNYFNYHFINIDKYPQILKPFIKIIFFIFMGIALRLKVGRYDYIMTYGTNSTGIAGVILKYINSAKLIVEIPGVPENGSRYDSPDSNNKIFDFRQFISDKLFQLVLSHCDRAKLLYETQLGKYPNLKNVQFSTFHDFVPTGVIESLTVNDKKYILTLGFPWYTKGVDILIRSFHIIANDFPEHELYCVGWYQHKKHLIELARDHPRIHIMKEVQALDAYKLISACSVFVLASRSEAMGRVLLEAMAAKKPIVASNTNGIPTYIKDGFNGLLVPPEDHVELATAISRVLRNKQLASELGDRGYKFMKEELNEEAYVRKFKLMINDIDSYKT